MTKKNDRKKRKSALAAVNEPAPARDANRPPPGRPVRWDLVVIFLVITIGGLYLALWMRPTRVPQYSCKIIQKYPHDPKAFTQGLVYEDGKLWESTGRYGESTIRQVDLKTGEILKKRDLDKKYFGEGCARWKDKLFQLTWKEEVVFEYDLDLNLVAEHKLERHQWGLTTDGRELILSDGGSILRFLNPETFEETHSIVVRDDRGRIGSLNELEFIDGKILANRWQSDNIYEIDPKSGIVTAVIDLSGIWPYRDRPRDGVLNGIALNTKTGRLLVTGKLCPYVFEIEAVLK